MVVEPSATGKRMAFTRGCSIVMALSGEVFITILADKPLRLKPLDALQVSGPLNIEVNSAVPFLRISVTDAFQTP